ncbi:MAG TPA: beta-galactosidase, partial [bacterium]|nr:beta-galactosidase [bacterium]
MGTRKTKNHPAIVIIIMIADIFSSTHAQGPDPSIPHLVHQNGRHALMVDGEPFLILGAQC